MPDDDRTRLAVIIHSAHCPGDRCDPMTFSPRDFAAADEMIAAGWRPPLGESTCSDYRHVFVPGAGDGPYISCKCGRTTVDTEGVLVSRTQ